MPLDVEIYASVKKAGARINTPLLFETEPTLADVVPVANETFGLRFGRVRIFLNKTRTWMVMQHGDPTPIPRNSQLLLDDIATCVHEALGSPEEGTPFEPFLALMTRLRIPLSDTSLRKIFDACCHNSRLTLNALRSVSSTYPAMADSVMRCLPLPALEEEDSMLTPVHSVRNRSVWEEAREASNMVAQRLLGRDDAVVACGVALEKLQSAQRDAMAGVTQSRGDVADMTHTVALCQTRVISAEKVVAEATAQRGEAEKRFLARQAEMCRCTKRLAEAKSAHRTARQLRAASFGISLGTSSRSNSGASSSSRSVSGRRGGGGGGGAEMGRDVQGMEAVCGVARGQRSVSMLSPPGSPENDDVGRRGVFARQRWRGSSAMLLTPIGEGGRTPHCTPPNEVALFELPGVRVLSP